MAHIVKLVSFPVRTETNQVNKVGGIKAIRNATGLGLKEAKDVIETLQDGTPVQIEVLNNEGLADFVREGGEVSDSSIVLLGHLRELAATAIMDQQYHLATDLIELLKKHS